MTNSTGSNTVPRIALLADSLADWTGGVDFLRFCVSALNSVSPETCWPVLLPSKNRRKLLVALVKNGVKKLAGLKTSGLARISTNELIGTLTISGARIEVVEYRDTLSGLVGAMRARGKEALFPCDKSLGRYFPGPWIGYIPDLQHKRLPKWFSERERLVRDKLFSKMLAEASAVVVNATTVIRDIEEFYPDHKARLFALPFCPPANLMRFSELSGGEMRTKYGLPAQYFMVSNQFWIHKSHETAFIALRQVRDAGYDVHLVCTGNTFDYRWPDHFNNLQGIIERNNLRSHIHILGMIPKSDQLAIMRESIAVIQPTLFEGGPGGGALYDAVSIGAPSIVSDIQVNREIDIGVVRFFTAGSAESLAARMIEILVDPPQILSEEDIFSQLRSRQREFGKLLLNVANWVANPQSS